MMEGLGAFILLWGMIIWGLWTMHQQKKHKAEKEQKSHQ